MAWTNVQGGNWLRYVPDDARHAIEHIQERIDPRERGRRGGYFEWWLWLRPSIGIPSDIQLIARSREHGHDREWKIMRRGQLCRDWWREQ